jgi:hypothetical protein
VNTAQHLRALWMRYHGRFIVYWHCPTVPWGSIGRRVN